jgi:hypothetical protein
MTAPIAARGTQCPRCGMRGRHADARECIDALRDQVAVLGLRQEGAPPARLEPVGNGGGRFPRADNRFVLLDGRHLILADAARSLGLSVSALHFRIARRVGHADYGCIDVREVGADRLKPRACRGVYREASALARSSA